MAATALTSTTLTNAITASQTTIVVGSTTGITAGTGSAAGTIIVCGKEAWKVTGVPVAGTVTVIRGWDGTKTRPANAAVKLWFGSPNQFSMLREGIVAATGDPGTATPDYPTPGNKVSDGFGNEFILCDFTGPVHTGVVVLISNDGLFTASATTSAGNALVGVCAEQTSTSDQMGLVQVYGTCSAQEAGGTSAATSAYYPILAGSVSSPATGMAVLVNTTSTPQKMIYGMFITGDATTAVTSAVSHTGVAVPVFLNYPYVYAVATDIGFS